MALFSKPPAKKSEPPPPPRPAPARQGHVPPAGASVIDWLPAYASIEVSQANPGLCDVLENAALLYAGGQADPARALLEEGVQSDNDAKTSPLAWLALFDLMQRCNDRTAFDHLAMQYVVQFERSAPAWEEPAPSAATSVKPQGGFVALTGKLAGDSATQWQGLRKFIESRTPHARLDLSGVTDFDDSGAATLASSLAEARRAGIVLTVERAEKLRNALEQATELGTNAGQGAWLLMLELMQWHHEPDAFDNRAVDYAVAFEVSPPSWEPPLRAAGKPAGIAPVVAPTAKPGLDAESLPCTGVLSGSSAPYLAQLLDFSHRRQLIVVDMSGIERVDFVGAGALLNAIDKIESQRKTVHIVGASPIIRALLLLIGISPRHFVKSSA